MSANAPAAPAKEKSKSKKMLVIIIVVVALLVVAGGAAAWFLSSRAHPKDDEAAEEPAPAKEAAKTPPTFLPMDNMVVNLADPGGERFAQIGITLEVVDAKTADQVKQYLPSIRSGVLMVISQRTSGELLQREGKEKLANDILREVSKPLGFSVPVAKKRVVAEGEEEDPEERAARRKADKNPVKRVLFSSFIIQ